MLKKTTLAAALLLGLVPLAQAADYVIDSDDHHAFIQFRISHLGYSYILENFPTFSGEFQYDPRESRILGGEHSKSRPH